MYPKLMYPKLMNHKLMNHKLMNHKLMNPKQQRIIRRQKINRVLDKISNMNIEFNFSILKSVDDYKQQISSNYDISIEALDLANF